MAHHTTVVGVDGYAKRISAPYRLVKEVAAIGKLPVLNFAAGGISTPSDAALMMQLDWDGVFVGSGIFKSSDPPCLAKAIVEATISYDDSEILARVSRGLGEAMVCINISELPSDSRLATCGW